MKRLRYALAALAAVAITSLVPATPATAAPGDGQCTVAEWRNPLRYADCAGRLITGAQQTLACVEAPQAANPNSDMLGRRPETSGETGTTGLYSSYGVAGYGLSTYDTCTVIHPSASAKTAVADMEFGFAAVIVGTANAMREYAYDPARMWGWADPAVDGLTKAVFDQVWSVWGALSVALLGCWLIWRAKSGALSQAFRAVCWAVGVIVGLTVVAAWPSTSVHLADSIASTGLATVQAPFNTAKSLPTEQCPNPDPAACVDRRPAAVRASDTITEAVLYRQWLQATLGSAESPTALKYGPILHDAATLSWTEAASIEAHPETRQQILEAKARRWNAVAAQIKVEDPEAYEHLRGMRGGNRIWAGMWAIFAALLLAGFDMWASFVILLVFLGFRIAVLLAPLVAVVGVYYPAAGVLKRLLNAVVKGVVAVVFWGAGVAVYLWAAAAVLGIQSLPGLIRITAVALVGVLIWWGLRRGRTATVSRLPWTPEPVDHGARAAKLAAWLGAADKAWTGAKQWTPTGDTDLQRARSAVEAIAAASRSIKSKRPEEGAA